MSYYVERQVGGHIEWLRIEDGRYKEWFGSFCLLEDRP